MELLTRLPSFFNSKECEWVDLSVLAAGAPVTKMRGISWKPKKDKSLLHAAGDKPIGIQSGNREYEGQLKVLKGALAHMNRAAIAAGGDDILDMAFDIVIVFRAKGKRALQTITLINCEVTEYEENWEQGATFADISMPFIFTEFKFT